MGDCPLFRLIETPAAGGLFERLARAAILTRPFADRPDWLRLGLPADAEALARLDAALADG
jgi:cobalamin biosynthetic protein CobC